MEHAQGIPSALKGFLESALKVLARDERILGVAAGGSYVAGSLDEYSDLDLVIVVADGSLTTDVDARMQIAERLGDLLTGFPGYHVREPRLLICLYGSPLLKVDLKFVVASDLTSRVEDPVILYDPQNVVADALELGRPHYPEPNWQWIEDAFWVWVHYTAAKIRRGELLDASTSLHFIIEKVLGPLSLMEAGKRPAGVRRIEFYAPDRAAAIAALCVRCDRNELKLAMLQAADLYAALRTDVECREEAQREALLYLAES